MHKDPRHNPTKDPSHPINDPDPAQNPRDPDINPDNYPQKDPAKQIDLTL